MQTISLTPINAISATATSEAVSLENSVAVSFQFLRPTHTSGNTKFEILGSVDGTNFTTVGVMMVKDVANTNAEFLTRAVSTTLSTATNEIWHLDKFANYMAIKIKSTITTDGSATCRMCVSYNN